MNNDFDKINDIDELSTQFKKERHILHQLRHIHDFVEKRGNFMLKQKDLTLAQGHVLGFLAHRGGKSPLKELEKTLNVAQSTSAGIVARLEKKGFVKTYTDQSDKRIKIIELEPCAIPVMQDIRKSIREVENILFSELSEVEKLMFVELLTKINHSIQEDK